MDKSSLIYPMFIVEGTNIKEEIPSMMGQYRYSVDRMEEKLEQLSKAGIGGVMLFGIPDHKDELGSGAYAQDGIVQQGFRKAKELFPDLYMIGDVCMCEYGTENRNIDRAEKQDSKESEYQRKEMSAGRTGSEEKNQ